MPKYIHMHYGLPEPVDELPEMTSYRLSVIVKFWEHQHAFSVEYEYAYRVSDPPTFNWLQVAAAHLFYNPRQPINGEWVPVRPYSKSALIDYVKRALEHGDDVIQQWFEEDKVILLLDSARTFEETLLAADAICGGHESNKDTLTYVERVLGDSWNVEE